MLFKGIKKLLVEYMTKTDFLKESCDHIDQMQVKMSIEFNKVVEKIAEIEKNVNKLKKQLSEKETSNLKWLKEQEQKINDLPKSIALEAQTGRHTIIKTYEEKRKELNDFYYQLQGLLNNYTDKKLQVFEQYGNRIKKLETQIDIEIPTKINLEKENINA